MAEAKRIKLDLGAEASQDGAARVADMAARLASSFAASFHGGANQAPDGEHEAEGYLRSLIAALPRLGAEERRPLDQALDGLLDQLESAAGRLQGLLERHSPSTVPEMCRQEAGVGYARRVVTYAHKLSFTTFAPPGWAPGRPLGRFRPPGPQDWQLRASLLHQFARDQERAKEQLPEQLLEEPEPKHQPSLAIAPGQPLAKTGPPDLPPDLPPMPPGWKPGDPLPDLFDLPPMPPGWKPGDELPGIASIGMPTRVVSPKQAAGPRVDAPQPPPAVEVRSAFDFILNPDLQEVEEDYSSDDYTDED